MVRFDGIIVRCLSVLGIKCKGIKVFKYLNDWLELFELMI